MFPADGRGLKDTQIYTDLFRVNQRVFNLRHLREIAFDVLQIMRALIAIGTRRTQILFFSNYIIQNRTEQWQEYDSNDPEDFLLRVFGTLNDIDDHNNINDKNYKGNQFSHN